MKTNESVKKTKDETRILVPRLLAQAWLPTRQEKTVVDTDTNVRAVMRQSRGKSVLYFSLCDELPHGAIALRLLIYILDQLQGSGDNTIRVPIMTMLIQDLGLSCSGGRNGTIRRVKKQLNSLINLRVASISSEGKKVVFTLFEAIKNSERLLKEDFFLTVSRSAKDIFFSQTPISMDCSYYVKHRRSPIALSFYLFVFDHSAQGNAYEIILFSELQAALGSNANGSKKLREKLIHLKWDVMAAMPDVLIVFQRNLILLDFKSGGLKTAEKEAGLLETF